jgi:hypothetical protein
MTTRLHEQRLAEVHEAVRQCGARTVLDLGCGEGNLLVSLAIEHIDPDRLSVLEQAVFADMRPTTVVITTPNAEFNPLLDVPSHRFRHPGHRFEWDRARFQRWARDVAGRNGYQVACHDIVGRHPTLGGASQMAVFTAAEDHPDRFAA